jgi:hypothetical protein
MGKVEMSITNEQQYNYDVAREKIADAIDAMKRVTSRRETSLVVTKLEEAQLWLGESLQRQKTESL